jgi:alpha-glucoside transport system substrate-binding protein
MDPTVKLLRRGDGCGDFFTGLVTAIAIGILAVLVTDVVVGLAAQLTADVIASHSPRVFARPAVHVVSVIEELAGGLVLALVAGHIALRAARRVDFVPAFVVGLVAGLVAVLGGTVLHGLAVDLVAGLLFVFGALVGALIVIVCRADFVGRLVAILVAAIVVPTGLVAGPRSHDVALVVDGLVDDLIAVLVALALLATSLTAYLCFGRNGTLRTAANRARAVARAVASMLTGVAIGMLPTHERAIRCREWRGELDYLAQAGPGALLGLSVGFVAASIHIQLSPPRLAMLVRSSLERVAVSIRMQAAAWRSVAAVVSRLCLGARRLPRCPKVAVRAPGRATTMRGLGRRTRTLGALTAAVILTVTSVLLSAVLRGSTVVWAAWTEQEQGALGSGFAQSIDTRLQGDALPESLPDAIAHGTAPDIAFLPQPGLLQQLAHQGKLKPLDGIVGAAVSSNLAPVWRDLATVGGHLYGVYVKAANKSTIWYNVRLFQRAGISRPPVTYDELVEDMTTLKHHGITPFAMCGGSGWTLTDWFENAYLRTAGQDKYNSLAQQRIPWTDPSVTTAFTTLGRIFDDPSNMVGGFAGAASTTYPACVDQVFGGNPRAAMLFEGNFVQAQIQTFDDHRPHTDYDSFPFPSIDGSPPVMVYGGDVAVLLHDTPQSRAWIRDLASPATGEQRARRGGSISPNQNVPLSAYPDDISRTNADGLRQAMTANHAVFDMSDQAPPKFGSFHDGEWAVLQDWVRHHDDPDILRRTQRTLEQYASDSYAP